MSHMQPHRQGAAPYLILDAILHNVLMLQNLASLIFANVYKSYLPRKKCALQLSGTALHPDTVGRTQTRRDEDKDILRKPRNTVEWLEPYCARPGLLASADLQALR